MPIFVWRTTLERNRMMQNLNQMSSKMMSSMHQRRIINVHYKAGTQVAVRVIVHLISGKLQTRKLNWRFRLCWWIQLFEIVKVLLVCLLQCRVFSQKEQNANWAITIVDAQLPNKERAWFNSLELRQTNKKMKGMGVSEKRRKPMAWNVPQLSFLPMFELILQIMTQSCAQLFV